MLSGILYAIKHATLRKKWLVIVTPSGVPFRDALTHFSASVPEDAPFSGRTAIVGDKGRVSVVSADQGIFVPKDTRFSVLFLGWGSSEGALATPLMTPWRESAAEVLSLV